MSYDCFRRSPYGISTPPVHPPVLPNKPNWLQALLHKRRVMFPNAAERRADAYIRDANTAQTQPEPGGSYWTKLKSDWEGGRRSDDITPIHTLSTGLRFPWPVGTDFGPPDDQQRKRDFVGPRLRGRTAQAARPMYRPVDAPYQGLKSSTPGFAWDPSAKGGADGRQDLVPIGGRQQMFRYYGRDVGVTQPSNIGLGYGLDFGPTPWRVPFMRKSGLSLMAGPHQFAQQQQWSGVASVAGPSGSVLAAPPVWGDITRGSRGVSGILQRVQGPGRSNVPGVFTPTEVR